MANRPDPGPAWLQPNNISEIAAASTLRTRSGSLAVERLNPGAAGSILQWLSESEAAAAARAIWFKPLIPSTRYTLDVVAGPVLAGSIETARRINSRELLKPSSLHQTRSPRAAFQAYYAYENSLTTLERVQFTTSRYATFSDQFANMSQIARRPGAADPPLCRQHDRRPGLRPEQLRQ